MQGVTHAATGSSIGVVATRALELPFAQGAVLTGALTVGALLADADQAGSLIWKKTRVERRSLMVATVGVAARAPLLLFRVFPHRTVTHSLPFVLAFTALCAWLAMMAAAIMATAGCVGFAAGYWLHLAGDACTPMGLPGWPVCQRIWVLPKAWRIPVGETVRDVFGRPVLHPVTGKVVKRRWSHRESLFLTVWLFACGAVFMLV